jgi:hypothetical protein
MKISTHQLSQVSSFSNYSKIQSRDIMKEKVHRFLNLFFLILLLVAIDFHSKAQTTLLQESFETDGEGTRYTSNTYEYCTSFTQPDYFLRTNTNPVSISGCTVGFGGSLSNLQGSYFWAGEDIQSNYPSAPPNRAAGDITFNSFSISGYSSLQVSLYLATASNNNARWESADSINIKISIGGGSFFTVGRFMGDNAFGGNLRIDSNLDGVIDGSDPSTICDTDVFTKYTFNIPNTGSSLQLKIDFDQFGGTEESAIDLIEIVGTYTATPTIATTGTLSAFTSCSGAPSTSQNFSVSATNLTNNLVVTAPTGFEVSLSSGSGYNSSVSLTPSSGTVSSTTIYVRLTSSASGSPSGNVVCSSTGATNQNISASGTVSLVTLSASSQTNVACFGGNTGAASVNAASGGTPAYFYNWTPGNPTGDGTVSVTGLTAGTWTVVVTDANSCVANQTFNITAPTAISVTPSSQTNVSCFGGANGAASINTPTGGAGGFSYNWTPGNPTGDGTVSVTGLSAGTWTCTVTDANSCTATRTFNITAPTALSVTPSSQTNLACFGGNSGAASINTASGGAGGFSYNWTPGNPTGDGTISVTGLIAGTWTCTVTDANSCTAAQTFNVTQPSALSVTPSSQTNIACFGGNSGAASINTASGGAGGYAYNWTPGNPTGDGTVSVTGLTAGSWTCTVTDANSCTATQTFNITQPTALSVTPASQTNVSCFGAANGAASINTPTGGAGGYLYNWTPGNPTGDGTVSVTGLSATTYTVTVTDANSCTATQTFNITAPTAFSVSAASQTNIACNGGANGAATINTPTGGAGGYVYDWTPGNPTGDGTVSVTGLSAATYTVTVTDANSCTATQTFNITEPDLLAVVNTSQINECIGGSNGTATVSVTGGTTAYTYSWSPSGGSASTGTGLSAGNYTVTVTDANACSTAQTFTIITTTEFTYTGNSPDDWLDEGNWSPCYPGTTIASGSTVIVSPGSNLVIPTGTSILNNGTVLNNGTITINGGTFNNEGSYIGDGAYTGGVFVNPVGGTVNPGE